ncbi:MAG: heavy-metal-associated domain-containing protein [Putridiphycobacter sp.]
MKNQNTYTVEGMTCGHCKKSVETNLEKLELVEEAVVNLEEKTVTVSGDVTAEIVKDTVNKLGYNFIS